MEPKNKNKSKKTVLFLCTFNSCRSQIAEALLNTMYGNKYKAFSAGIKKAEVDPYAVEVMKELGIDISNHYSKKIQEFSKINFDFVVTLCDSAKENCPYFPGKKIIHKSFKDPNDCEGDIKEILKCYRKLRNQIKDFIMETFN